MIQLCNLGKIYKGSTYETEALIDVNLEIQDGEFVAIMGSSGSGKSTLLNILGCMDTLTSGQYILDEKKMHELKLSKINKVRKEKISFVFQHFALMNEYSVYDNVELPLLTQNLSKRQRKEKVKKALEELSISELSGTYPTQISGGQQQRVAIARALVSENNYILADEPTGALDRTTGMELMHTLEKINKMGKTIILVTHDSQIAEFANRIIRIEEGRIVSE